MKSYGHRALLENCQVSEGKCLKLLPISCNSPACELSLSRFKRDWLQGVQQLKPLLFKVCLRLQVKATLSSQPRPTAESAGNSKTDHFCSFWLLSTTPCTGAPWWAGDFLRVMLHSAGLPANSASFPFLSASGEKSLPACFCFFSFSHRHYLQ